MKKAYKKLFSILFIGLIGISVYAQGTWKADSTMAAVNASTEITTGITGLSIMHSDAAASGISGKSDAAAIVVTYNDITWDNKSFIQGSTNDMYYAFRVPHDGTLDISVKMGSKKATFVLELTDTCPDNANLAALTTNLATGGLIFGTASYFILPSVYDTYHNSSDTWNGSAADTMQASGSNKYLVMSFTVKANKTYVVGCIGSKLMLRGINYKLTSGVKVPEVSADQETNIFPNPAKGNVFVNTKEATQIGIYNAGGLLMKQQLVTPSDNSVNISELAPGVYFIKDLNGLNKTQKLIVK